MRFSNIIFLILVSRLVYEIFKKKFLKDNNFEISGVTSKGDNYSARKLKYFFPIKRSVRFSNIIFLILVSCFVYEIFKKKTVIGNNFKIGGVTFKGDIYSAQNKKYIFRIKLTVCFSKI